MAKMDHNKREFVQVPTCMVCGEAIYPWEEYIALNLSGDGDWLHDDCSFAVQTVKVLDYGATTPRRSLSAILRRFAHLLGLKGIGGVGG